MDNPLKPMQLALAAALAFGLSMAPARAANPCNPCAAKAKNPCAAKAKNPCAAKAKNPCAAGAAIDPKTITRPAGYKPHKGDAAALLKEGEKLWNDPKLSTNGMSCNTCHQGHASF